MFLLDTEHISILQTTSQPEYGRLAFRMAKHDRVDFCYTIVSFHEQVLGAHGYVKKAKDKAGIVRGYELFHRVLQDYAKVRVLAYDGAAQDKFATLRAKKIRVGTMDLRIAAIALVHDFTVLTKNSVDFEQVPDLKVEDWTV